MANILALGSSLQLTSAAMLVTDADIFTDENVRQSTPTSATIVTTPPTFAGIVSATPNSDGSVTVGYAAATTVLQPVEYEVHCLPGSVSAATLFAASPALITTLLSEAVFFDSNGDSLSAQNYTFGVRARDRLDNLNLNTVVLTTASSGVISGTTADFIDDLKEAIQKANSGEKIVGVVTEDVLELTITDDVLVGTIKDK